MDFKTLIGTNEEDKPRSKNTIQTYTYDFKNMIKHFYPNRNIDINDERNYKILDMSFKDIMEKLETLTNKKRQKRILNIIIVLKKSLGKTKEIKLFREQLKKINMEIQGIIEKNLKNDKQKKNWIGVREYEGLLNRLDNDVKDIFKKGNISPKDRNKIQEFIILSFYHNHHLRNDLAELKVLKFRDYEKLNKDDELKNNWLIIDGRARSIILNNYKTNKTFKKVKIVIDKELARVIRKYLKLNTTGYLIINQKGVPLTRNTFSVYVRRMFKKYTGKKVGTSLLRHIFITKKLPKLKTIAEKKELATNMLHSVSTQALYNKID